MKILALLLLLIMMACQDTLPKRDLIDDSQVSEPGANVDNPTVPTNPVKPIPVPAKLHSRCQSTSRCFYANFPVYEQGFWGLENYIGNKLGKANYTDPGLCGPTAGAMILKAVLNERDNRTKLNNVFLTNVLNQSWYETVYQLGRDANTDFINGGTYTTGIYFSFLNYFRNTAAQKSLYLTMEHSWSQGARITNSDIINLIKTKKPALYIGVKALVRHETYINGIQKIWHAYEGPGHALAIKGFDGDRLHIQDPWGMDNFVRLEHQNFPIYINDPGRVNGVMNDLSSNSGTYFAYYGRTNKIVLEEVIALGLD
jgi:hypothetical protein